MKSIANITTDTLHTLWRNWAIAFGSPALVTLASLLVPPIWLPLICLLMAYMLLLIHRRRIDSSHRMAGCSLVIWLTMIAMAGAAVITALINIVYSPKVIPTVVAENPALPFITSLVVYPLMCAVSLYGLLVEQNNCCQRCQATNGYYDVDSSVATFYSRESHYQLRMALTLSAAISVVATTYYFLFYINVNLNSPDRFFFVVLPLALYLLSLGYMVIRYFRMYDAVVNNRHGGHRLHSQFTLVRYLLFSGDCLLLSQNDNGDWDTPVLNVIDRTDCELPGEKASAMVEKDLDSNDFTLRFLYQNGAYAHGANVLHYAVFLPEDSAVLPKAMRCSFDDIQRLLMADRLSPYITNELYRIHNITMAWKTYDRRGRRLYPIRHYKPTFRLRDLKDWDVDYNDIVWLRVAGNNEDKPLYHVRRFINRYLLFQKSDN